MYQPLDGPAKQYSKTVTDSTVVKVEETLGGGAFEDRAVVTLQPSGKIKVYFGDEDTVPSAATVGTDGMTHFKDQVGTYEAGKSQHIYMLADSGSVTVVVIERG